MKWMKSRIASCYCSFVVTIIVTFTILGLQNIASSLLSIENIPYGQSSAKLPVIR